MKKIIALLTTLVLTLVMVYTFYPVTAHADDITISSGGMYDLSEYGDDTTIHIKTTAKVTITQTVGEATYSTVSIICDVQGVNLVINNLRINNYNQYKKCCISFMGKDNKLYLMGSSNFVAGDYIAGIVVPEDADLTISDLGNGSLYVRGGVAGAGIGGDRDHANAGSITINSGKITATTINGGAGIGGGDDGYVKSVTINGGTVSASCPAGGAGIGGGLNGAYGLITITGGTVNALGNYLGAGIGGGGNAVCGGIINISGGVVFAHGRSGDARDIGSGSRGTDNGQFVLSGDAIVFLGSDNCTKVGSSSTHKHVDRRNPENGVLYGIRVPGGYYLTNPAAYVPGTSKIITYVSNSDSAKQTQDVQFSGDSVIIEDSDTFSRDFYALGSWNTQANGKGTGYALGEEVTFTKDTILFAKWEEIPSTGFTLDQSDLRVELGDTYKLTATFEPYNATNQQIDWESYNDFVLEVDSDGVITTLASGKTKIKATHNGHSEIIDVEVWVKVKQVNLSSGMYLYDTMQLSTGVEPNNASNPDVTVTSSDSSILSIDSNFVVTAAGVGTAKIYVTTEDNVNTTYTITVSERPVAGIQVIPEDATMEKGDTLELTAVVTPDDATDTSVTWTSSDTSVATVATDGTVTAASAGEATITATSGSFSDICVVTVLQPVTSVDIDADALTLAVSGTAKLNASLLPANAQATPVYWSSSDGAVASVDDTGLVTAIGIGTATITATANGKTDTCTVTVSKKDVSSVSLDTTTKSLYVGDWFTLSATVSPPDASVKSVSWTSSDTSVATVTSNGTVEAVGNGSCDITATADGKSASCTVTVTEKPVSSVTLDTTSKSLYIGDWFTLSATVSPSDASDKSVTWNSSDTSVATVTTNGTVEAVGDGACTITATAGGKSASCSVSVGTKAVTDISLDYSSQSLYAGGVFALTATVKPDDAADPSVSWSSSDTSVATVNSSGVVTAQGVGSCKITAQAGTKIDSCSVTVKPDPEIKVESVSFSVGMDTVMVMYVGDTSVLNANVSPSNADNKSVTWQSSDSSVATVSATGKVTAVAAGEATITITASDKSDSYRVLVKEREQASAETGGEEPPATTTQATQQNSQPSPSPEAEVVLSFNIDTASLPYGAQYIELPNGEIVEVNGKDTVTCDICSKDLISGTIKIVALDAEKNPLGVVDVSANKSGLGALAIILIALVTLILGASGMLIVVRSVTLKKK